MPSLALFTVQPSATVLRPDAGVTADSLQRLLSVDSAREGAMQAGYDSLVARGPVGGAAMAGPPSATIVWGVLAVLAIVALGGIMGVVWLVRRRWPGRRAS